MYTHYLSVTQSENGDVSCAFHAQNALVLLKLSFSIQKETSQPPPYPVVNWLEIQIRCLGYRPLELEILKQRQAKSANDRAAAPPQKTETDAPGCNLALP